MFLELHVSVLFCTKEFVIIYRMKKPPVSRRLLEFNVMMN
jgi:hypothetical protein